MKSLVVYESAFGNTESIAFAIRDVLSAFGPAEALRPDKTDSEDLKNYDLIVVGSPTQKFRPMMGTAAFLKRIPAQSLTGRNVAAFDTRIDLKKVNNRFLSFMVRIFGYAADRIAHGLKRKGGKLVLPAEGFFVDDTQGPVSQGELDRAKKWAHNLIRQD